jgi:hypothetical protein
VSWSEIDLGDLGEANYVQLVFRNEAESLRLPRIPPLVLGVDSVYVEKSE